MVKVLKRTFCLVAVCVCLSLTATGAPQQKKKSTSTAGSKTAVAGTQKKPVASTTRSRARTSYSRTGGRRIQPVAPRRSYGQQKPSDDRLREIQEALSSRGYLQQPSSGAWDPATVEALKRFQEDQNLPPTGKITSLSLIALGLGPKRNPPPAAAQNETP